MGKPLPDRWLEYRPIGKRIEGTRFIAFKTPLKETFNARLTAQERFTPEQLIKTCPELGVIIDLTNTSRYYTKEDILRRGVEYEKVTCPGQVIPPLDSVMRFFKAVDHFLYRHKNDDSLIGVHCTHGVNRTGYMLSRYMIQRLGIPLSKAVASVEKARGYKIERPNFIDHLKRCTSPMPLSTYTPERELNKGGEMRGRKAGDARLHAGEGGRGSPREFADGRRRRTRSPSPHRQSPIKYQELHQRDKMKFGFDLDETTKELTELTIPCRPRNKRNDRRRPLKNNQRPFELIPKKSSSANTMSRSAVISPGGGHPVISSTPWVAPISTPHPSELPLPDKYLLSKNEKVVEACASSEPDAAPSSSFSILRPYRADTPSDRGTGQRFWWDAPS